MVGKRPDIQFQAGQKAVFSSTHSDAKKNGKRNVEVEIVRPLTDQEADLGEVGPMFKIRFADGHVEDAFVDELTPQELPQSPVDYVNGVGRTIVSKVDQYKHLREEYAGANPVRLGDDATADQVTGELPKKIVIEPVSIGECGQYTITVNVPSAVASTAELRGKLQAAYDEGAAGSFSILTEGDVRQIVFNRDFSDDYEMLLARVNSGEPIHSAAKTQLADELEKSQSGPDCVTAVILALRDITNGVVVGLGEHRKLPEASSPYVLGIATAMDRVRWAERSMSSGGAWWSDPAINDVVNAGVSAGYLRRSSTTQVEWSEAGVDALRAAYAARGLTGKLSEKNRPSPRKIADALEACDWSNPSIGNMAVLRAAVDALRSTPNGSPDFDAVRDKRRSEMTPAQRDDAQELWLREQVGWMGDYHEKHYRFLFKRLDEARGPLADDKPSDPSPGM
jgi:hypothetical protein